MIQYTYRDGDRVSIVIPSQRKRLASGNQIVCVHCSKELTVAFADEIVDLRTVNADQEGTEFYARQTRQL